MMDDFERTFTTALRSATPAPPTEIDPAEITRVARRGRIRTIGAPLLSALVVAGVVVAVLAMSRSGGGQPHQAASPPTAPTTTASTAPTTTPSTASTTVSRQPGDLVGYWVLTDLQGFNGAAHADPDAVVSVHFWANGAVSQGCDTAVATAGVGTLEFTQSWVAVANTGCPHLGLQQHLFVFARVLAGTASWVIRDGVLTVRHDSAAATFQRVGGELTPAQRKLATHIAKTEAQTSPASTSSAPSAAANGQPGWPSNVAEVWAIVTTHADAMQYVGAAGGDTNLVLVIRLVGNFSWITTGPPGHGPATGNVMTIVADAHTGTITDTGLEKQNPPQALPDATVLYRR
jgi:hypothetical protein